MARVRKPPLRHADAKIMPVIKSAREVIKWWLRNKDAVKDRWLLRDLRELQEVHRRMLIISRQEKLDSESKQYLYGLRRMQKAIMADIAAKRAKLDLFE